MFSTFASWGRSARPQYVSHEVPLYLKDTNQKKRGFKHTVWLHANCLLAAAGPVRGYTVQAYNFLFVIIIIKPET